MNEQPCHVPDPHPLDYDWRYTPATVEMLLDLLPRGNAPILAVGAPSVARALLNSKRDVVLVDRQPFQGLIKHFVGEPGSLDVPKQEWEAAVVDPPWYYSEWRRWIAWTARSVGVNRCILVSVWPINTRPNAERELLELQAWASEWSDVSLLPLTVKYECPPFEHTAIAKSDGGGLASSPRTGQLLSIKVRSLPGIDDIHSRRERWVRFVINDYQLALRLDGNVTAPSTLRMHPNAKGWYWPYVSVRAPGRETIGLWSSQNEVAVVENGQQLADTLRAAFSTSDPHTFELALAKYAELCEWRIPRPPYWRIFQWHHLQ